MKPTRREMNMQNVKDVDGPETVPGRGSAIDQNLLSMLQGLNARIYNTEKAVESAYSALYGLSINEVNEGPLAINGSIYDMKELINRSINRLDNIDSFISLVTQEMSHD